MFRQPFIYVYACPLIYMCIMYMWMSTGTRKECLITWDHSFMCVFSHLICVLGTKHMCSAKAESAFNPWAMSAALSFLLTAIMKHIAVLHHVCSTWCSASLHPKTNQPTNCAWKPVNFKCKWIFHPYKLSHILLQSKKPNRINKNKKEHDIFTPPFLCTNMYHDTYIDVRE